MRARLVALAMLLASALLAPAAGAAPEPLAPLAVAPGVPGNGRAWELVDASGDPATAALICQRNVLDALVRLDGAALIAVPDLQAATAKSSGLKIAVPQAGEYGLLAASQAQVSLQQMTLTLLK